MLALELYPTVQWRFFSLKWRKVVQLCCHVVTAGWVAISSMCRPLSQLWYDSWFVRKSEARVGRSAHGVRDGLICLRPELRFLKPNFVRGHHSALRVVCAAAWHVYLCFVG
jgi:hypothetical protein